MVRDPQPRDDPPLRGTGLPPGGPRDVDELQTRLAAMREQLPEIEGIANSVVARRADLAERQASEQRGLAR